MKIKVSNELMQLKKLFNKNKTDLFVVGGFVRDSLLLLNPTDVDVCSMLTNEELFALLEGTGFNIKLASKKLGTTVISKNNLAFEHTTFRAESYKEGGFHSPEEVEFVTDIKIDAKRRDFTVNSLYYDLQTEEILDFFGGICDLNKKQIKAIVSPEYVFKSDGLRILRMVRLAAELDFKIDKKTFKTAKNTIEQLNDVSKDRKYREFLLILAANEKYGFYKQNSIKELIKLNALEYIFPNLRVLTRTHTYKQLIKGFNKRLYYFNGEEFNLKLERFMLDISLHLNRYEHTKPSVTAIKILNPKTCGISFKRKNFVIELIKAYEQSIKLHDNLTAKMFIQDHNKVLSELLELLNNAKDQTIYKLLKNNLNYMLENKMPLNLSQLKINGNILKEECKQLPDNQIGILLKKALKFCVQDPKNNTKTKIIKYLKKDEKLC